ncbi:hypothetical protein [Desulfofustis limnaeus]|uniref:Uncharacterized protein n=1 Tax=Desulfofustis limnaeus TaxID=2740163 RepID=A0ABN6M1T4_9BACT|nr:hypothetical protein [Desulfofustis limnaeus]BDD85959.1 hypothetical protein DPPLL_03240 [Desulfofustis limnaeus]
MDLFSFTIGVITGIAIGALLMIERFLVRDERKYVHLSAESNAVYIMQLQVTEKEDAR